MALKINSENKAASGGTVKPGKRLYLTADKSALVPEGDPAARFLYCTESGSVPRAEYERLAPKKKKRSKKKTASKKE